MTKRPAVADLLKAIKKQKAERESRTYEWAAADLKQSCGLEEGAKIYVRYEYQDIGLRTPSEADSEQAGDVSTPGREPGSEVPRFTFNVSIMGEESSEGLAPGEKILSQKVVWWPAVISPYKCAKIPGAGVPSVRQVYELIKSEYTPSARACVEELLEQKGEAPVWQIDYEARDAMESESVPAFFIDRERLCHLHPEWAESAYRAHKDIKDPSELEDDLVIDAKTAIRLAYNLDESGDEEEEDFDVSQMRKEDVGVKNIMSKFAVVMRSFLTRASESGSASVTAEDVWEIFADCANESHQLGSAESGGGGGDGAEGEGKSSLQEQPFPRLEEP